MAQQTAVEWLVEQLPLIQQEGLRDVIEEAKAQERGQIVQAYHRGLFGNMELKGTVFADEYYKQTYNK